MEKINVFTFGTQPLNLFPFLSNISCTVFVYLKSLLVALSPLVWTDKMLFASVLSRRIWLGHDVKQSKSALSCLSFGYFLSRKCRLQSWQHTALNFTALCVTLHIITNALIPHWIALPEHFESVNRPVTTHHEQIRGATHNFYDNTNDAQVVILWWNFE